MGAEPDATHVSESSLQRQIATLSESHGGRLVLIDWLRETAPVYLGRGTSAVQRIRGAILLALANGAPLADVVLLYVLEDLDNSRSAYSIAAAAECLRRGAPPHEDFAPVLLRALNNLREHNDYVDLSAWGGLATAGDTPTARVVVLLALRSLGALPPPSRAALGGWLDLESPGLTLEELHAVQALLPVPIQLDGLASRDQVMCCPAEPALCSWLSSLSRREWTRSRQGRPTDLADVLLEDQDGRVRRHADVFAGKPGIVAFFYTRCENPNKCSLTITNLGHVQELLVAAGAADRVRTTAITYDPGYDEPARLLRYANARDMFTNDDHCLMRAVSGWPAMQSWWGLGVNYVESLVNRHRIEIYIHDHEGCIVASFERLRWDPKAVAEQAMLLIRPDREALPPDPAETSSRQTVVTNTSAPLLALLLALFPKCPICGVAYLSLGGLAALPTLPGPYVMLPVLLALFILNLVATLALARKQPLAGSSMVSTVGAGLAVMTSFATQSDWILWIGVALTILGSVTTLIRMSRRAGLFASQ